MDITSKMKSLLDKQKIKKALKKPIDSLLLPTTEAVKIMYKETS